ncbi:hypothetical protein, partial [Leucobacter celer]|uniref:hypothetical protein n=1 Tax=Leucobacter celer TaxID=668625 RepID=UPI00138F734C
DGGAGEPSAGVTADWALVQEGMAITAGRRPAGAYETAQSTVRAMPAPERMWVRAPRAAASIAWSTSRGRGPPLG